MKDKILIVEDEKILAMGLAHKLSIMGYEVAGTASTGLEAIKIAGNELPDLVLMDIVLKGEMDGIEAANEIINRYNVPIIYLTAYADETLLERAMVTEPYGYLTKPYKESELKANIKMAIYKHRTEKKRKESIKNQLMDNYYQFIFENVNKLGSNEEIIKDSLKKSFEKSFEEKMQHEFFKILEINDIDLAKDDEYVLFEIYASWISKLFQDFGIRNKLKYDDMAYYLEFFNCPWMPQATKNPIFCINCHAMISCSFKWINLEGKIDKKFTIADDSPECKFIIQ